MLGWLTRPVTLVAALAFSTISVLSRKYRRLRLYYHLFLYTSTLGVLSVWGVLVSIAATITGHRLDINYIVARSFYHVCSPIVGIRLQVEGEEHLEKLLTAKNGKGESAVLVGNHQSFVDILYLGRIFPRRASIMAKRELKWVPLLGQYLALSGAVFVDRNNRLSAREALEKAGLDMKRRGVSLWVFPEGTRTLSAEPILRPFKKGAFHLAIQAKVPIIPIICENYHRLFDGRSRMDEGVLRIKVLPPVSTDGMGPEDVDGLTESTRQLMQGTLLDISRPSPPSNPEPAPSPGEAAVSRPSGSTASSDKGRTSEDGSGGQTTEDEMDDDAVLLKRPVRS